VLKLKAQTNKTAKPTNKQRFPPKKFSNLKQYLFSDKNWEKIFYQVLFRIISVVTYGSSTYWFIKRCSAELYGELVVGLSLYLVIVPIEAVIVYLGTYKYHANKNESIAVVSEMVNVFYRIILLLSLLAIAVQSGFLLLLGYNKQYYLLYVGVMLSSPLILVSSMMNSIYQTDGDFVRSGFSKTALDISKALGISVSAEISGTAELAGIITFSFLFIRALFEVRRFNCNKIKIQLSNLWFRMGDAKIMCEALPVLQSALISLFFQSVDKIIVNNILGRAGLGLYNVCLDLVSKVYPIAQIPSGIVLTHLLSNRSNILKVRAAFSFLITYGVLVASMYYSLVVIILNMFKSQIGKGFPIHEIRKILYLLAVGGLLYIVSSAFEVALNSIGLIKNVLKVQIVATLIYLPVCWVLTSTMGVAGAGLSYTLFMLLTFWLNFLLIKKCSRIFEV